MPRKTPQYHDRNVHGVRSPYPVYRSRVIKSFSLTMENARYLESVPKGEKSDVVNRALAYYRGGGRRVDQIMKQRDILQDLVLKQQEELDAKGGGREQKKKTFDRKVSIIYVLTYPLQLLKERLSRRD